MAPCSRGRPRDRPGRHSQEPARRAAWRTHGPRVQPQALLCPGWAPRGTRCSALGWGGPPRGLGSGRDRPRTEPLLTDAALCGPPAAGRHLRANSGPAWRPSPPPVPPANPGAGLPGLQARAPRPLDRPSRGSCSHTGSALPPGLTGTCSRPCPTAASRPGRTPQAPCGHLAPPQAGQSSCSLRPCLLLEAAASPRPVLPLAGEVGSPAPGRWGSGTGGVRCR